MATIRKRGNDYFIDYRIDGKRVRKTVGPSKNEAQKALAEVKAEIAQAKKGTVTLAKLITQFRQYIQENLSLSSQNRYNAILENLLAFLQESYPGVRWLSQFHLKIFEDFKKYRQRQKAQPRTVNTELTVLRQMFGFAKEKGYLRDNPTDGIEKLKVAPRPSPRYLSVEESQKLLSRCDDWSYPVFFTLLNTGLRKNELENLCWSDIDFKARLIKVVSRPGGAAPSAQRTIPINESLYQLLQEQIYRARGSEFVFPDERGARMHPNRLRNTLIKLARQAELKEVTQLSVLRYTFAAQLIAHGASLSAVQKLLGFKSIKSAMIYDELLEQQADEAIERLEF